MNPFFTAISGLYIFAIFFWADSPGLSRVSEFNPFSLLHIPLYGIMTGLLLLAFASREKGNARARYFLVALIPAAVGILDEYYQSFIPSRDASLGDILLDLAGISLAVLLACRFPPYLWARFFRNPDAGNQTADVRLQTKREPQRTPRASTRGHRDDRNNSEK
jgi:VanZ family protein